MKTYKPGSEDRKALAARVAELTGLEKMYTGVPRCAYIIGAYAIERDGTLNVEEQDENEEVIRVLVEEGLVIAEADEAAEDQDAAEDTGEPEEAEEPAGEAEADAEDAGTAETQDASGYEMLPDTRDDLLKPEIAFPAYPHTGISVRNLVNLLYSRGALMSKSTGGNFGADEGVVKALEGDDVVLSFDTALKAITDYEAEHGPSIRGVAITKEKVSFDGFPEEGNPAKIRAFMDLAAAMNKQALKQNRIRAKVVEDENEKYIYRIWLVRIGLDKKEYKETRRYLLANLSGHTAFHTPADGEKWKARQKAKKEELKRQTEVETEAEEA